MLLLASDCFAKLAGGLMNMSNSGRRGGEFDWPGGLTHTGCTLYRVWFSSIYVNYTV